MWSEIREKMLIHPCAKMRYKDVCFSFEDVVKTAEKYALKIKPYLEEVSRCGVICSSPLNMAIAILSAFAAGATVIPMSENYGKKHCIGIVKLTAPDIIVTDGDFSYLGENQVNIFEGDPIFDTEYYIEEIKRSAVIMCTSGTTGYPKGAVISAAALLGNVERICEYQKATEGDRALICRPLYHCAVLTGEFLAAIFIGMDIVFRDTMYDPIGVLRDIIKHEITYIGGTPSLLCDIADMAKRDRTIPTSVKDVTVSGECLTDVSAKKIRGVFPHANIYNGYGMTEASPRVAVLPPEMFDISPTSVGYPLRDVDVLIARGHPLCEVARGTVGDVFIKSPCLMDGYCNALFYDEHIHDGDWFCTGDVGYIDERGLLYILGRGDDMIIKGGMNIYPSEIESEVKKISCVKETVAYGEFNDIGQEICLDVVLNDKNKNMTKNEVSLLISKCLPKYLIPSKIKIVSALSKNGSGKVLRR